MTTTHVHCNCGSVEIELSGDPLMQYLCHCDDCQVVHGGAYPCALFRATAVVVTRGDVVEYALRTTPRTKCSRCETYLFAEVPGYAVRGLNAHLLPEDKFTPQFHIQCRYAASPLMDDLPHYKGLPPQFGGSDELMHW